MEKTFDEKKRESLSRELEDKTLLLDTILEGTLAGYWDWNIPENTEFLSPTFKSMFGYEDHELPNSPESWQKIIHPEDLPGVIDCFNKHVESRGKIPFVNEVRYFHKQGHIVWVYCRGKVIEWADDGSPVRMVGSHVEITSLKEALSSLEREKLKAENHSKELEQFAFIASHDLQEPLRSIIGFAEILKEDSSSSLGEENTRYLDTILQSSKRMNELILALLDHARLGVKSTKTEVDCSSLLKEIQEDLADVIERTKTKIHVEPLPTVKAFGTELRLLFQNLIVNAIKFGKKGVPAEIKVYAKQETEHWHFFVEDNGIGIDQKNQSKIFQIFQSLHADKEYEGSGIGLAHCKKIVNLHGGTIGVDSKLGEGATFHFTIPAK